jgi:hypothetical protein
MPAFTHRSGSPSRVDLDAFAHEQTVDAGQRYARAADVARVNGAHDVAELFETLAQREPIDLGAAHGESARVRALLPPALIGAGAGLEEAMCSALLTPYQALALAVQEAQLSFAVYAQVAALAKPSDVRRQAENLALNELARSDALRRARRLAFRAERPSRTPTPATLAQLRALAVTWEAGTETGARDRARRLAQAFERYLSVAEHAASEDVLAEAQARATDVLRRMLAGSAK